MRCNETQGTSYKKALKCDPKDIQSKIGILLEKAVKTHLRGSVTQVFDTTSKNPESS